MTHLRLFFLLLSPFLFLALAAACSLVSAPAVLSALDLVAEEVLKRTGQEMDTHPTHCEYENDPDSGKLLILCTVCYDLPDGERCS